jgi:hypothetical protein
MPLMVTDTLKKVGDGSENQSVSGVTNICLMQRITSHSHRVDQAVLVACGMFFNGCVNLLEQTCSMIEVSGEYVGHGKTDTFSASRNCVQILLTRGRAL